MIGSPCLMLQSRHAVVPMSIDMDAYVPMAKAEDSTFSEAYSDPDRGTGAHESSRWDL
jgi:hypothetical protein